MCLASLIPIRSPQTPFCLISFTHQSSRSHFNVFACHFLDQCLLFPQDRYFFFVFLFLFFIFYLFTYTCANLAVYTTRNTDTRSGYVILPSTFCVLYIIASTEIFLTREILVVLYPLPKSDLISNVGSFSTNLSRITLPRAVV